MKYSTKRPFVRPSIDDATPRPSESSGDLVETNGLEW
jgi:hypothetical protein